MEMVVGALYLSTPPAEYWSAPVGAPALRSGAPKCWSAVGAPRELSSRSASWSGAPKIAGALVGALALRLRSKKQVSKKHFARYAQKLNQNNFRGIFFCKIEIL